ncbi:hypothetical protein, partial [Nocardia cerradoensis]|uniref:hypothetical protein n=1 Tax=Nocardia cerradoensis TaxID=85688 RepID=UPI001C3F27E0
MAAGRLSGSAVDAAVAAGVGPAIVDAPVTARIGPAIVDTPVAAGVGAVVDAALASGRIGRRGSASTGRWPARTSFD